ncbi:hypothetical protein LTS18_006347, partial [Coniosporium uncinatum]
SGASPVSPRVSFSNVLYEQTPRESDESGIEIPWRLRMHQHWWNFRDDKNVGSDTNLDPSQFLSKAGAITEILSSWVSKEAIEQSCYEYTSVQEDVGNGRKTRLQTLFCIKRALTFPEVERLVDLTADINEHNKERRRSSLSKSKPHLFPHPSSAPHLLHRSQTASGPLNHPHPPPPSSPLPPTRSRASLHPYDASLHHGFSRSSLRPPHTSTDSDNAPNAYELRHRSINSNASAHSFSERQRNRGGGPIYLEDPRDSSPLNRSPRRSDEHDRDRDRGRDRDRNRDRDRDRDRDKDRDRDRDRDRRSGSRRTGGGGGGSSSGGMLGKLAVGAGIGTLLEGLADGLSGL